MKIGFTTFLFALYALLAACGFSSPPPEEPAYTPVVAALANGESGATVDVEDAEFGGAASVTVGESFISASGEECRRGSVLSAAHEAEVVVICRPEGGFWRLAPRIWGQGMRP